MLQTLLLLIGLATPSSALSPQIVEAAPIEIHDVTLQEKAVNIATAFGISTSTFSNIIQGESNWDNNAVGKLGELGLFQILPSAHPDLTKEQMLDIDFELNWAANEIKQGREWQWTECSCIKTARAMGVQLPKVADASELQSNSPPRIGGAVLFHYKAVDHVAYIKSFTADGTGMIVVEGNFEHCKIDTRFVSWNDPFIKGYWAPPTTPPQQNLVGKSEL